MNLTITPKITPNNNSVKNNNILRFPMFRQNSPANSNLAPLARDTVSFSGNKEKVVKAAVDVAENVVGGLRSDKVAEGRIYDFNYKIATQLEEDFVVPMGYFENVMNQYFRKLVSTEVGDDRIIQKMSFRIKSTDSIFEKMNAKGFDIKEKAKKVGEEEIIFAGKEDAKKLVPDGIAGRITLRDSSKKSVKKILQILGQIVKDGKFKVKEAESFRPVILSVPEWVQKGYQKDLGIKLDDKKIKMMTKPEFFNYADGKDFAEFVETCRLTYPGVQANSGKDLPNGYQAIHVNVILPDGNEGEIQIMGRDIEHIKELVEDYNYKKKCNKEILFGPLDERLAPLNLKNKDEAPLQAAHENYTRWVYIGERLKAPESFSRKPREKFLTAPKAILERGLGFNQLAPLCKQAKAYEEMMREENHAKRALHAKRQ